MSETADFKDRDSFDEGERELCPDGNCTGLIGAEGRCKICGLALDGSRSGAPYAATARDEDVVPGDGDVGGGADAGVALGGLAVDDADDRQLCPDGNCIGLIGSDGKCKVCGRSAAS
jgi:hypothetical protein